MRCWKGSLWCQEFQDFYIFYGIHFHDMITIFDHFSSLRRAVERHTVKTKSGAPGLAHSQICLTMHALGKANVKIKDRFLGKKRRILMAPVGLGHRYHMLSTCYHHDALRSVRLLLPDAQADDEERRDLDGVWYGLAPWLHWLSMTQCVSKVYIIPVPNVFRWISMWVAFEVGVVDDEWWFVRNDCNFFSITYVWRISRILYGMRKRRLKPRNPEQKEHKLWARVLRAVAAYFRQKMHFISPKGIVYILYEFGKHGIFPGSNHWYDSHRSLSWKRHCMKNYIYIM